MGDEDYDSLDPIDKGMKRVSRPDPSEHTHGYGLVV